MTAPIAGAPVGECGRRRGMPMGTAEGTGRARRPRAGALALAALAAGLCAPAVPRAADLPPFQLDDAVLARAQAVQALPCAGGDEADGFAPVVGAPAAWHLAGALVSVRRAEKDRFAFVLGPPGAGAGDCPVSQVIPLPRRGELLECSLPGGGTAGLGVHALLERGGGRRLVLWSVDGGDRLRPRGEDKTVESDTGLLYCALPDESAPAQPAASASARADLGVGGAALALLGMVLSYAVLGAPSRAVAAAFAGPRSRRLALEVAGAFAVRLAIAWLFLGLLSLPGAVPLAAVAVLACLFAALRRPIPARRAPAAPAGSRAAEAVAALLNEGAASLAGLLCCAVLARHDARLLVLGVALAAAASAPGLVLRRRRLRRSARALGAAGTLLAAVVGLSALADPWLTAAVGGAAWPRLVGPILFAAAVGVALRRAPRSA